jgi:hypothetical protein
MKCKGCRGSGFCPRCAGTGRLPGSKQKKSCTACSPPGSGKCATCGGRGEQPEGRTAT